MPQDTKESRKEMFDKRKEWLLSIKNPYRDYMVFELEVLLKGLERFFNIQNLPLSSMEQAVALNFRDELEIVHGFIIRIERLSKQLLTESKREFFQFRQYVERSLISDVTRAHLKKVALNQESPNDSLFLVHTTFANVKGIVEALIKQKRVSYALFASIGNVISRELLFNRFFNPFVDTGFRPEYDRIENRKVSRLVMRIKDDALRRSLSVALLALYRLLKYLEFIDPRTTHLQTLKSYLLFFSLINSEARFLAEFLDNNIPKNLKEASDEYDDLKEVFLNTADSLAFQLTMELRKINKTELVNASKTKNANILRGNVENSHGILTNFFQQSIIQLVRIFEPGIEGKDVFSFFTSRLKQGLQLRHDILVMHDLMDKFEERAETNQEGDTDLIYYKFLNLLKDYILYFRQDSINLLRYDDLIEFGRFFDYMEVLDPETLTTDEGLNDFIYQAKYFKIFLETTIANINNRSDLIGRPPDRHAIENFLKEFIISRMKAYKARESKEA